MKKYIIEVIYEHIERKLYLTEKIEENYMVDTAFNFMREKL